mmetsp:Transcript_2346/g.7026  ORF Transcript_2346/g.7026 Transcript_2346/m.7026 type:complete len:236 (-) Transcript_2346:208-915(-)
MAFVFGVCVENVSAAGSTRCRRRACAMNVGRVMYLDTEASGDKEVNKMKQAASGQRAGEIFQQGVNAFTSEKYENAAKKFEEAADTVRGDERLQAEYKLWQAQALNAARHDDEALELLHSLGKHSDLGIRRAVHAVERVVVSPEHTICKDFFIEVPAFHDGAALPSVREKIHIDRPFRSSRSWTVPISEPARYSLEWYKEKKPAPRDNDHDMNQLVFIASVVFTALFVVSSVHHI